MSWTSRSTRAKAAAGLSAFLVAVTAANAAFAAKGDLHLVSRQSDSDGGAGANGTSFGASVSGSGRFVAFNSSATNLGLHDGDSTVYVYDFKHKLVETVSRQSGLGLAANGFSVSPEISRNGRFVAFRTDATNLGGPIVAGDNVYVYDRRLDKVQLVSRRSKSAGGGGANLDADVPTISANGRYLAYNTRATNLGGPIADDGEGNVYVYDRKEKRTFLVSRRSNGGKGGTDDSYEPSIAPHAPVVVFQTQADNLGGPINPNASANVYAYDWRTREVELVSRRSRGGRGANEAADAPDVSANGRLVVFETEATNLGGPLQGADATRRVYLHDRESGRTTLVSRQSKAAGGQGADGNSSNPAISNSGRFAAFASAGTNLGGPIDSSLNVYVYDRERKRAILASRGTAGGPGADDYSASPALSGGGKFVAFYTPATNIDPPGEPAYHGNIPIATNVFRFQFRD